MLVCRFDFFWAEPVLLFSAFPLLDGERRNGRPTRLLGSVAARPPAKLENINPTQTITKLMRYFTIDSTLILPNEFGILR